MTKLALKSNDELRAMNSLRKRPELRLVRVVMERALLEARQAYENSAANEAMREEVDAHKAMIYAMFDADLVLEEGQ